MGDTETFGIKFDVSTGVVNYDLYLTMGYGSSATKATRLLPKYFLPEFNRKAAWKIQVIPPSPFDPTGTWNSTDPVMPYPVFVRVYDWQQEATVTSDPDNFGDGDTSLVRYASKVVSVAVEIPGMTAVLPELTVGTGTGSPASPLFFQFSIANENLLPDGEYVGVVRVVDERIPSTNLSATFDKLIHSEDGFTTADALILRFVTYQTFSAIVCGPCL